MTPKEFISLYHKGSLKEVPNVFSPFISTNVTALSKDVIRFINEQRHKFQAAPISTDELVEAASHFHSRANTLTPNVLRNIENIRSGGAPLRLAHQTNLFISANIATQLAFLNGLSVAVEESGQQTCELYISIDYDIAEDSRFRISKFPDHLRRNGCFDIAGVVQNKDKRKLMKSVTKPDKNYIYNILDTLKRSVMTNYTALKNLGYSSSGEFKKTMNNFGMLSDHIWEAYELSETLVDFNTIYLSIIANRTWNLPTSFIYASKIQKHMLNGYDYLLSKAYDVEDATIKALHQLDKLDIKIKGNWAKSINKPQYWLVCSHCQQRMTEPKANAFDETFYDCQGCHTCAPSNAISLLQDQSNQFEIYPKVLFDNLLESVSLGVCGGIGYIGQAEHLVVSSLVGKLLDIPLAPQSLFSPAFKIPRHLDLLANHDKILTEDECLRLEAALHLTRTGKASIAYFEIYEGLKHLKEYIRGETL